MWVFLDPVQSLIFFIQHSCDLSGCRLPCILPLWSTHSSFYLLWFAFSAHPLLFEALLFVGILSIMRNIHISKASVNIKNIVEKKLGQIILQKYNFIFWNVVLAYPIMRLTSTSGSNTSDAQHLRYFNLLTSSIPWSFMNIWAVGFLVFEITITFVLRVCDIQLLDCYLSLNSLLNISMLLSLNIFSSSV